mmetsp:Transcript_21899/g.56336  ORF Transcript_21899/g.56336 Transcript_21899/m.56336 type:complete len:205 (+) Transcript_21899:35-649(+)
MQADGQQPAAAQARGAGLNQRPAPCNMPEAENCCGCQTCPLDKGALGVAAFQLSWNVLVLLVALVMFSPLHLVWGIAALVCSTVGAVGACQLSPLYLKIFQWWLIVYNLVESIMAIINVALLPSFWPFLLLWFILILPIQLYCLWIVWSTARKTERGELFTPTSAAVVEATHAPTAVPAVVQATVVSTVPAGTGAPGAASTAHV